jgi:hypothetical protein
MSKSLRGFHCQEVGKMGFLSLADFKGTMILDEAVYCFVTAANSHNDLIILANLDVELPSAVSINAFLVLSHKEETCLAMSQVIVNKLCQLLVGGVVFCRLVQEVDPLKIIHVVMNALKLSLSIFYLY